MADLEKLTSQITTLINSANSMTGNNDDNLTDGINSLINGYGKNSESSYFPNGYLVTVFDYDGTILKEERLLEGSTFVLPSLPKNPRLKFHSWSSTVDVKNNTIIVPDYDVTIGPIYTTVSGATEFDIRIYNAGYSDNDLLVNWNYTTTGLTRIDWGDGVVNTETSHEYSNYGDYTIKAYGITSIECDRNSGVSLWCNRILLADTVTDITGSEGLDSAGYLSLPPSLTYIEEGVASYYTTHITFPNSLTELPDYVCCSTSSLRSVVIPNTVTSIGESAFDGLDYLKYACVPDSVTYLGDCVFYGCGALSSQIKLSNVTIIPEEAFHNCYTIPKITLNDNITSIKQRAFYYCCDLAELKMPAALTEIETFAFGCCFRIREYDFTSAQCVPLVWGNDIVETWYSDIRILVPANLYDAWINEPSWEDYVNYIECV